MEKLWLVGLVTEVAWCPEGGLWLKAQAEGSRLPGGVILLEDDNAREHSLMTYATVTGHQEQTQEA